MKYSRKCSSFLNSRRVMKPFPSRSAALYALICQTKTENDALVSPVRCDAFVQYGCGMAD